jgi:hypothetical protein
MDNLVTSTIYLTCPFFPDFIKPNFWVQYSGFILVMVSHRFSNQSFQSGLVVGTVSPLLQLLVL